MLNVFLVDDEYYERLALKKSIAWDELGMTVSGEANNGQTAYEMILESPPDIAIVDINMPKMDGLELIERLKGEGISCQFIILTGYDDFGYAQRAVHLNVSEYILKPINYQNLIQTLQSLGQKIRDRETIASRLTSLQRENRQLYLERCYNELQNSSFNPDDLEAYGKKLQLPFARYQAAVMEPPEQTTLDGIYRLLKELSEAFDDSDFTLCLDNRRRLFFILNAERITERDCPSPAARPADTQTQNIPARTADTQPRDLPSALLAHARAAGFHCRMGVGEPCSSLDQILVSYNEACVALKSCSTHPQPLLFYKEVSACSDITRSIELYVQQHYADPELSISAIAGALYLNYSYLCYCFKRDRQMTINDYIIQIRIAKAVELFQNHVENIGFVAEKTGFTSASYFSKQFKKATGVPPSEYIRKI